MLKHWPKSKPRYVLGLVRGQIAKNRLTTGTTVEIKVGLEVIGYQPQKEQIDPYYDTPMVKQRRLQKKYAGRKDKEVFDIDELDLGDWILG